MDFIDEFMEFTDGRPSPDILRLWAGIAAVAGALERRVWSETAQSKVYPNMFVLLVAPPGVGKTVTIDPVLQLWADAQKFHVAPDNVTKASLIDSLKAADRKIVIPNGLVEYHTLLVACSEFGVLVPSHDLEFLSVLNHIYDNPKAYRERRRFGPNNGEELCIIHPQMTILAGTQPGYLASLLPEQAWGMGFTSRLVMVYANTSPDIDIFGTGVDKSPIRKGLIKKLQAMGGMIGKFHWTDAAKTSLIAWYKSKMEPVPTHTKLAFYNSRRLQHTIKLAMASAASRTQKLTVDQIDVERARTWLLTAERYMPDVFREMSQKSDAQVIQEMHYFMWAMWAKDRKPIHESMLFHFLSTRVPSEKVSKILEIAERSNIISRAAGTQQYVPRPLGQHGVE